VQRLKQSKSNGKGWRSEDRRYEFKGNFNSEVKGAQLKLAATNSTAKARVVMGAAVDLNLDLLAALGARRRARGL
jgi:hypothetical protein